MRNGQLGGVATHSLHDDEIQVEGAWTPSLDPLPAVVVLDAVQPGKKLLGSQCGIDQDHTVEEVVLVGAAHGGRLVESGDGQHVTQLRYRGYCRKECRGPVTEIRPESHGSACQRHRLTVTETSSNGTASGACGLWTVTSTARTRSSSNTNLATRSAIRSSRFHRSVATRSWTR